MGQQCPLEAVSDLASAVAHEKGHLKPATFLRFKIQVENLEHSFQNLLSVATFYISISKEDGG